MLRVFSRLFGVASLFSEVESFAGYDDGRCAL